MKKLLLWIISLVFSSICIAQAPNNFKYQAVARDASGNVMENQNVSLRISILQGSSTGTVVFRETHSSSTNEFGLLNITIGNGTSVSGSIEGIQWAVSDYYISIEMDPEGGSNYSYLGSGQLLSVPYALHAKTVEDDKIDDADADPSNEIQTMNLEGNELTLSKEGGTVTLPEGSGDDWGSQIVLTEATLEGDGTVTNPLKIARQGAIDGQVLKWNGSTWMPSDDININRIWEQNGSKVYYAYGNVGIGTSDPVYDLQLHSLNSMTSIQLTNSTTGTTVGDGLVLRSSGSEASLINKENGMLSFGINNSSYLHLIPGGYLGVGTMAPQARIDVAGQIRITGGNPGTGKVLTSDETGLASWQTPSSSSTSLWQQSGDDIYYDSGKVGIGITDPVGKLHIHGEGNLIGILLSSNTSGSTGGDGLMLGHQYFGDASSQSFGMLINNENTPLMLGTDGLVKMSLLPNGDFGIGLIDPSTKLDVNGQIRIRGGSPGSGKLLTSDATGLASWQVPSVSSDSDWSISGSDIYSQLSGNVGIGNTNPEYKLDVLGNRIRLIDETNDWIAMRTDGSPDFLDLTYRGGHLAIQGNTDGENIVLVPSKNSKVGIHTWVPAYTLDVNGDMRATGSVYYGGTVGNIDGTIYIKPDFVFTNDYETLSTEAVDRFIRKNKHLPWITSAKQETKENKGAVNMTRMQFETVETIENLQLQIIELNKKVEKLSQLVYKQQQVIKKLMR